MTTLEQQGQVLRGFATGVMDQTIHLAPAILAFSVLPTPVALVAGAGIAVGAVSYATYQAIMDYPGLKASISSYIDGHWQAFNAANAEEKARMVGELTATVASFLVPAGEVEAIAGAQSLLRLPVGEAAGALQASRLLREAAAVAREVTPEARSLIHTLGQSGDELVEQLLRAMRLERS